MTERFTCSICKKEFTGGSNNAEPVNPGRCCDQLAAWRSAAFSTNQSSERIPWECSIAGMKYPGGM